LETDNRQTICVDFDGTIVEHAFPNIGALKAGVKEAMDRLIKKYRIKIYSYRSNAECAGWPECNSKMAKFLEENEIPFDEISAGKELATFYIDDRGLEYKDDWEGIANRLTGEGNREESALFPMHGGPSIPWSMAAKVYVVHTMMFGADPSLEQIAATGGWGWGEVEILSNQYQKKFGRNPW